MGTRADFYIGRGKQAEWMGSIAWDGYPSGIDKKLLKSKTEDDFKNNLESFFAEREDVSRPADGWPWPWDDSGTTDFSYAFDGKQVWASCYGHGWHPAATWDDENSDGDAPEVEFPNMADKKSVTFGKRSGLIVIGGPPLP